MSKQNGFTLIEVLVAVTILSVMSIMAYGGMNYVFKSSEQIDFKNRKFEQLQVAFRIIKNDLELAVDRPVRDRLGTNEVAFLSPPVDEGTRVIFTTNTGSAMQLEQSRSTLQRVEYVHEENQLLRKTWAVLDRSHDTEPHTRVLLHDVDNVIFEFINKNTHEFWPLADGNEEYSVLPRAVKISMSVANEAQLERLFMVRAL